MRSLALSRGMTCSFFQVKDDAVCYDEVQASWKGEPYPLISQRHGLLALEGKRPKVQLVAHSLFVRCLHEAGSKVAMNLYGCSYDSFR